MLFTCPSRYSSTIGHTGVFSLGGWSPQLHARLLVSGVTQELHYECHLAFTYRAVTVSGAPFQGTSVSVDIRVRGSYNPAPTRRTVWALPVSLATTQGISIDFSSSGYLDVSVPQVRSACAVTGLAPRRVAPFGHLRINACVPLPGAYRSLPRPSSPLCAQASPTYPCSLDSIPLGQAKHALFQRVMRRYRAPGRSRTHRCYYALTSVRIGRSPHAAQRPRPAINVTIIATISCQSATNRTRDQDVQSGRQIRDFRTDPPKGPPYSSLRKGGDPAAGSPTATLLRLRPSHCARLRRLGPLRVPAPTSGAHSFHGVTGGVYKARERIHRGVADPRLLAIPASCRRVAADNLNWARFSGIGSTLRSCVPLYRAL